MPKLTWFTIYVSVMFGLQWVVVLLFHLLLRRRGETAGPSGPVCVVVPCKGPIPDLADNARAMLAQERRDADFLFVVPSESDPAYAPLMEATRGDARAQVLVSRAGAPRLCSGKIVDLLYALERLPERCELVAFADADLRVRPDWLSSLLAPLDEPGVAVTTACALYVAADPGFWSFLRMAWMAAVVPYAALMGCVIGHSFAMRRREFFELKVPEVWSRSLLEDISLAAVVRGAGRTVRFVGAAMSASAESCDQATYVGLLNKWVLCLRVYDLRIWGAAFMAVFMHAWIIGCTLVNPRANPWLPVFLILGDAAAVALQLLSYEAAVPDRLKDLHPRWRPLALWGALAAPLLWVSYAVQLAHSITQTTVRWGGRVYALRGPQDVEVVG
jgi:hypothetical protein